MLPREHYLKQTFQDAVNFPEGFEKGGLSDIQARLVRKQGALINALIMEEVADTTSDDLHMLKVIANLSAPKSPVEQAWMKYQSIVKAKQAATPTKAGKTRTAKPKKAVEQAEDPAESAKESNSAKANTAEKPARAAKATTAASAKTTKATAEEAKPKATKAVASAKKTTKKVGEKV